MNSNWKDIISIIQPVLSGLGLFIGAMVILGFLGWFTYLKIISADVFVSVCSLIIGAWVRHISGIQGIKESNNSSIQQGNAEK